MSTPVRELQKRHQQLARQLAQIGPVIKGSVVERYMPCGKTNCRCQDDPPKLHGPYWQWSTAVNGKTVTRRLNPQEAALYLQWIDNRKRLERLLEQMFQLAQDTAGALHNRSPKRTREASTS